MPRNLLSLAALAAALAIVPLTGASATTDVEEDFTGLTGLFASAETSTESAGTAVALFDDEDEDDDDGISLFDDEDEDEDDDGVDLGFKAPWDKE